MAGASVPLTWDPSADPTVVGYKIYYGSTSHGYTNSVDVGNVLGTTITGLANNITYYFAATTYTASGVESDFSDEAAYLAQSVVTPPPVYQPPTLDPIGNVSINESAALQTVNLTGISLGSGQSLTITATSSNPSLIPNPSISYASPSSTGSLSFAPTQFANGTATITVTANNGIAQSNTVTRTFTINVAAVNQAPTLNAIGNVALNYSSSGSTAVSLAGITSGAANENQKLTVTAVSSNPQLVPNPTVNYTSPNTTGSLSLKTAANTSGSANITVTVNDGGTSNNVVTQVFTVTVTPVYQPPTLNALANASINQNASQQTVNLSGIGLGSGQALSIAAVSSNPSLVPNPVVNYTSPSSTGSLNYTPVTNANGTTTITVTADNGQPQNNIVTRTFTINVAAVNQLPTLDPIGNVTIVQNASLQTVNLTGISLGSGQSLTITATSSNPSLIPNPSVSYASPSSTGSLSFTPAQNGTGTATITVTANNGFAPNNIVTRTFTVTVAPANQPPTLNPIGNIPLNYSTNTQTIGLSGISSGSAGENQKLTVTAVSSNPQLIPNPTVSYTSPNTTANLSMKTAANVSGTATITVTVNDGAAINNLITQTFTVYVTAFFQPPTLNALADISLNQNVGLQTIGLSGIGLGSGQNVTITATSSDPAVIPDPVVNYTSPATTGSLSFTPNSTGPATITVTVNNGQPQNNLATRTFTVNVANSSQSTINQSPTLDPISNLTVDYSSAGKKASLTGIAAGTKGTQKMKITAVSNNPGVVPNPTVSYFSPQPSGSLNVKPAPGTNGTAIITVTLNDGGPSNNIIVRAFNVTVAPNQPPTLDTISNLTLAYNSAAQKINLSGITPGAFDEIQKLKITAISSNPKLIPNPKVSYKASLTDGSLSFKPATGTNGTALITVFVNDGGKNNNLTTRTFTVTILPAATSQSASASTTAAATLSSGMSADGKFSINVNGIAGYIYVVQASTDLVNWVNVNTNTSPFTFVDNQSAQFDKRYYRTVYTAP